MSDSQNTTSGPAGPDARPWRRGAERFQQWRRRGAQGVALALVALLSSCGAQSVNPATGQSERLAMSREQEQRIGDQEHPKILAQMGGVYDNSRVTGYVAEIGGRLAVNSELPNQRWTFTVLDSPIVNAFALPGGYVYVTRGLIALANSEAELAGVIGHEIGHVTGRHTAQRIQRAQTASIAGVLATIGAAAAGIDPRAIGQAAQVAGAGYVASFSRDQELEADRLGVRYISRAGYDPFAQADFLSSMQAQAQLNARMRGRDADVNRVDFFSTHPATAERTRAAAQAAAAQGAPVGAPRRRSEFLNVIESMTYGDSRKEGFVRGERFIHPGLRFEWSAPSGYRLTNSTRAVKADGPDGRQILFDADQPYGGPMADYVGGVWARKLAQEGKIGGIGRVDSFTANGIRGATVAASVRSRGEPMELRLVAYDFGNATYRFTALYPARFSAQMNEPLRRMTFSMRRLSAGEANSIRPLRLRSVTVRRGDTVAGLSRQMAFADFREERFRVLNGLGPRDGLQAGQRVKIVVE